MKLISLFLFLCVIQVNAKVFSQNGIVKFEENKLTVEQVFDDISAQLGYDIFYSEDKLNVTRKVEFLKKENNIKEVLNKVLEGKFKYQFIENTIIIMPIKFGLHKNSQQKYKKVKGKVVDSKGNPIPGATVLLEETTVGVSTDKDGNFTITIPKDIKNPVLFFSFVGMKTNRVEVKNNKLLEVVLQDDVESLNEVVVTGYQKINKTDMAGSSQTIKKEDLVVTGTNSLEQMLQGKIPGMTIVNQSGLIGSKAKVRIRGTATLLGNQEPVWVVDGIIQEDPIPFEAKDLNSFGGIDQDNIGAIKNFVGNSISWLNPNDIKDITVLKDASATAIYGVKAANGVIVITTKKGQKGSMSVSYSGGISTTSKFTYDKMNLMNSKERIDVSREIYENGYLYSRPLEAVGYEGVLKQYLEKQISFDQFNSEIKRLETVNTDWLDMLYRHPLSTTHSISLSGGDDKTRYYGSFGINNNVGNAIGNEQKSYTASININSRLTDKISVGMKVAGSFSKTKSFYRIDPYTYATQTSRAIPCFDEEGNRVFYSAKEYGFRYNILNELDNTGNRNSGQNLSINLNIEYKIIDNLKFKSIFGASSSASDGESYATERSNYITGKRGYEFGQYGPDDIKYKMSGLPHGGELNTNFSKNFNYTWRNIISYNRNIDDKNRIGVMIGQELRSNKYDGYSKIVYGYFPGRGKTITPPPLETYNSMGEPRPNLAYAQSSNNVVDRKSNYFSLFSTLNYTYDNRYAVNFSIRTDASNRFGQNAKYKFQPVWSAGFRWNIMNEHWLDNQNIINSLSIRTSYGFQGNVVENFSPELIARIPSPNIDTNTGEQILKIKSLAYADLRWEKNKSFNTGIDWALFKNRFSGTFEYYHKKTEDVINQKSVPYEYGVTSMPINGGTITNRGWEISVNTIVIKNKDFQWNLGFNTSKNYNEVTCDINQNENWKAAVSGGLNKKGYPVSSIWAFKMKGLDHDTGMPIFDIPDNTENPDGRKDATSYMKFMGTKLPDLVAGLSSVFRYKQFSLNASFNLNVGGKKFLAPVFTNDITRKAPSAYNNLTKNLVNRWRKPGDEEFTNIPSLPNGKEKYSMKLPNGNVGYLYEMYNYSEDRVRDASFLRCNNISMSYVLPKKITDFLKVKYMSIQGNIMNPFIITKDDFDGLDPEVATGSQPISRTYSFNININF